MQNPISAYIVGFIVMVVMIGVSAFVSNLISFRPDNSDCKKRKVWFWIFGFISPVLTFVITLVFGYLSIKSHKKADNYMIAIGVSSVLSFLLYLLAGWIISKTNKHGKLGNWF